MSTKDTNSLKSFKQNHRLQDTKKKHFKAQMTRVSHAFYERPKTMLEVSKETNVMRANICRYVAKWLESDEIDVIRYGVCPISKRCKVGFYTTDKDLFVNHKIKKQ